MESVNFERNIMITGGAGFIGSHVVRLFVNKYPSYRIINVDALTYAGNLANLTDIENAQNYIFEHADIKDENRISAIMDNYQIDGIIHLAAESHVDRSISGPMEFALTNVVGTLNLLNIAKNKWSNFESKTFYHISTDEVYGSLSMDDPMFSETTPYDPRSPYSASKASSDHFVRAYFHTYGMPIKISNCSNNYGSHQFPEKLIPLMINNIVNNKELPIYGKGDNIRDWLWVEDHAKAIDVIFHKGENGETYNIGGLNEWTNLQLVETMCDILDEKLGRVKGTNRELITFVKDRLGHDKRYAIDATKIEKDLNWKPSIEFEEGLEKTIDWYLENQEWVKGVTSGDYQKYYEEHYRNS